MSSLTITQGTKDVPSADKLFTVLEELKCKGILTTEIDDKTVTAEFNDWQSMITRPVLMQKLDPKAKPDWWNIKMS